MPKLNWVIVAALGLVITSAFSAWALWSLVEYQERHVEQRQSISSYEAETAEEYLRICRERSGISIAATLECLANSAQVNRQTQATEYDLTAQQEMAEWAFALLLVSLFSVVISVSGLVALFASLAQTRTVIKDTREIGEAQVRAYVSWDGAQTGIATNNEHRVVLGFSLTPKIKNTGQSLAKLVALYSHGEFMMEDGVPTARFDLSGAACSDEIGAGGGFNMATHHLSIQDAQDIFFNRKRFYLMGWGSYRDVFWKHGDPDRHLRFCFQVTFKMPPELALSAPNVDVINFHSVNDYVIEPAYKQA